MTSTTAQNLETAARLAEEDGDYLQAHTDYQASADAWQAVADQMEACGETLIASVFSNRARTVQRKADLTVWLLAEQVSA